MAPKSKDFYPTNRDILLKTSESWMNGKRLDDNLGPGLWRVHDGLYDLRDFAARVSQQILGLLFFKSLSDH